MSFNQIADHLNKQGIETVRGKVYLAGITSRPNQLETLVNIIKNVKGVREVVNYVVVKE